MKHTNQQLLEAWFNSIIDRELENMAGSVDWGTTRFITDFEIQWEIKFEVEEIDPPNSDNYLIISGSLTTYRADGDPGHYFLFQRTIED